MKKTTIMTESAVAIALAAVCSFIKVWEMPQGGSVALTMVPLLMISFRRGATAGIVSGAVYGIVSLLFAGRIYHPMSVLLDYLLAFGFVGVAGFFKKNVSGIVLGSISGVGLRFLSSLISGAVLFADYAPEGQNPWMYSFVYQATYLVPELVICIALMLLILYKNKRVLFF